jgi:ribosome maturation factor RimP
MSNRVADADRRFARETGTERSIADLAEPVLEELGFRLVRVKVSGRDGGTVQIMAERADGQMSVEDCATISRRLSPVLDAYDPMPGRYRLEVSSPGIDRPLVRARDFERFIGHEAKVELADMIEGRKRFRGDIVAADADSVTIRLPDAVTGTDPNHKLPLAMLAEAKLVMTDKLLKMAPELQDDPQDDPDIETVEVDDDQTEDDEVL